MPARKGKRKSEITPVSAKGADISTDLAALQESLEFFDADASIGRPGKPGEVQPASVAELLAEMKRLGIRKALVKHMSCWESGPFLGNERLMKEIAGYDNLIPVWCLVPDGAGELGDPDDFVQNMVSEGVRAAWATPQRMVWSLAEWCCGGMLGALEKRRVPLMLQLEETTIEDLRSVLKNHPRLPVILVRVSYRLNRLLFPLLERHENLHLCVGPPFSVHLGIEEICRRFGHGRLVYGSSFPAGEGSGAATQVSYAEISAAARRAIAFGNLDRLVKGART
ncbi:MAG TPA: hypothetical protein PL033_04275 [Candidatus Brocadiia bacterium]|nr:hypothetical protein [Candidatus Brocadiia bacterium]